MTLKDLRARVQDDAERKQVVDAALVYFEAAIVYVSRRRETTGLISQPVAFDMTETRRTLPLAATNGLSDQELARALADTAYVVLRETLPAGA